ncbi:outer membrane beta-barrel protein [uncultured Brachyspira sp.]|uniref:outer membrane beta-barrel protein n=1 Tax=uncultured Brachyspira sp. TaxID=221953 RepID=UPI0025D35A6E|nr:outer membrane beta-barrel protein [uncultured Brachyspira sp.]
MIKKFLFVCLFIICLTNMLKAYDIGLYLAPKFIFELEGNKNNMYTGGGLSIGYNFDIFNKYSTLRTEFEYLYRNPLPENVYNNNIKYMQTHSFLFAFYYDFSFLYEQYNDNDSVRSKLNNGKRPIMSVYAGVLLGLNLNSYIKEVSFNYNGIFKESTYYNKTEFIYGFGFGFAFHITSLISLDLGYRILLNENVSYNHDIIASLRLNF